MTAARAVYELRPARAQELAATTVRVDYEPPRERMELVRTAYAVAKPTGAVDWGENASRWVDNALSIVRDRFRAGDQAAERDHLYRMAQQQYENDRDERAFRLKIEEIRARYGGLQTQQFRVEDSRREERKTDWVMPVALGAVGLGILYVATR